MQTESLSSSELVFPVQWHGRVMCLAEVGDLVPTLRALCCAFAPDVVVTTGNRTSAGTYVSYRLSATIVSLEVLRTMCTAIEKVPGVRMVL